MSLYKGKVAHGVALDSLTTFTPQPSGGIVRPTRRDHMANGVVTDQGLYVVLTWSALKDVTALTAIYTVLGLHNATSREVTIYVKNDLLTWARYNGRAVRPVPGEALDYRSRPKGVQIVVRDLVLAT